ncbi:MAG: helix-turn-helix domain-containing protein [Chloroflexota bacterium]|nr:helix-turn-helix domain-containing protein [Chloroflexota bacterium]
MYKIVFTRQVYKSLRRIPRDVVNRMRKRLDQIAEDPYAQYANVTKLQNRPGYRLRVGDWRVIYAVQEDELIILVLKDIGAESWFSWRYLPMNVQIIKRDGNPEWAVIPYKEYLRLAAEAEMLRDVRDYDATLEAIEQGEETIPSEIVYAILDGANPIRVWRQYRELTQQQLSEAAGISKPYLSQIESGKRTGTTEVLSAIANALNLTLDDIVKTD